MQIFIRQLALVAFLALAGCGSDSPESQLNDINAMLAKNHPLTAEQKAALDQFMAQGQQLLQGGQGEQASQAFEQALKILKQAEDTAMFNKSE